MTDSDLTYASIVELARQFRERKLSPVEFTRAALERCEKLEPRLNAFITLLPEAALQAARQAEDEISRGQYRGLLHGVPLGIKDLFWTRGVRTTAASRIMTDFVPDEDAAVVERLRAAGAVIFGKTNMVEFAYGPADYYQPEFGPTRNPWAADRFCGGSSTGSGVAVAAGILPGALGSDTAGSIRNPASFSGITGLKPTYGLISAHGAVPLAASLDHMGPLTRSAEDCAVMLQVLAGFDPRDPSSVNVEIPSYTEHIADGVRGLRLGLPKNFFLEADIQPEVLAAVEAATAAFRELGAEIIPLELPNLAEDAGHIMAVMRAEASAYHRQNLEERPGDFVEDIRQKLLGGLNISAVDYIAALEACRRIRQTFNSALDRVDAILTPTRDTTAPRMAEDGKVLDQFPHMKAGRATPTIPFNAARIPAISVPCGFDENGLPIGLTISSRAFDDAMALRVAHAFQQATDWHTRHPVLSIE
jgi:aspartyl-tRNA(Asn)/glutamyl-tRNA(Gln) amidotransferase subunit A